MKFGDKTAIGVDISENGIRMVVLRRGKAGVELVRSAGVQMPEEAIKNGNIEDAALLTKALRILKRRCRIRTGRTAAALFGKPAITQMIDMPKQVPGNIRQYVQSEVKQYIAVPGKDIVMDFCAVAGAKRAADKRVLAVITDSRKMTKLVKCCSAAGLDVEVIEPPLLAYTRAVHAEKVAGRSGVNVLIAMLRGSTFMLGVFRNQIMDFVRAKDVAADVTGPDGISNWLADEIVQVVQFYDIEVLGDSGKWEMTVFIDFKSLPQGLEERIKSKCPKAVVHVQTTDNAYLDMPAQPHRVAGGQTPSPVAVGLAMRMLDTDPTGMKVNVMPGKLVKLKAVKTDVLVAANIAAAIMLLLILAVAVPARMTEKMSREVAQKQQTLADQDIHGMLAEQKALEKLLQYQSEVLGRIAGISQAHRGIDWASVLEDIGRKTPKNICITNIESKDMPKITVEGLASSNEAVQGFIKALRKSKHIRSASLVEAEKYDQASGIVKYEISCSIASAKGSGLNGN